MSDTDFIDWDYTDYAYGLNKKWLTLFPSASKYFCSPTEQMWTMFLTNPSYIREGVMLDKLLEALIITPVDYSTITKVDKNGLIISARILSYGKEYPVKIKHPATGNILDRVVDLSKLKHSDFNLVSDENGEFDYKTESGIQIKFKTFLDNNDFFKHSPEKNGTFQMIKKEGIFLNEVFEKDIKDFVLDYITDNDKPEGVYNLMSGNLKFFKREFLGILTSKNVSLLKDDKDSAYLFYTNCIVKVATSS